MSSGPTVTKLDEVTSWLRSMPSLQDLEWQIKELRAVREWALGIQPVKVGDRVAIADDFTLKQFLSNGNQSGWWPYRESLVPGTPGRAVRVDYSVHAEGWIVDFTPELTWSISTWGAPNHVHRYIDDRQSVFQMRMDQLRLATDQDVTPSAPVDCTIRCANRPSESRWLRKRDAS